jgi:hypothetical protein
MAHPLTKFLKDIRRPTGPQRARVSCDDWNRLLDIVLAIAPNAGPGLFANYSNGTSLSTSPDAGTAEAMHPYFCLSAVDADNPRRVRVILGACNGNTDPFSAGDSPPTYLTVSGDGVVYLKAEFADPAGHAGAITSLVTSLGSAATLPTNTATTAYLALASFSVDGDAVTLADACSGSVSLEACQTPWVYPPEYEFSFSPV